MVELSDIERFQRWLQSNLADVDKLPEAERESRRIQIESAIQEVITFNELISVAEDIAPPFVEREQAVRSLSSEEKPRSEGDSTHCVSCNKTIDAELGFCPSCGEYL